LKARQSPEWQRKPRQALEVQELLAALKRNLGIKVGDIPRANQAPFSNMQKDSNSENKPLDMTNNKRLQPLAGDRRAACDQYGYEL
jgi:hypothetical protein